MVLGGVDIPFDRGLTGWSDADVLTHALMDALLGAVALGDIGSHFPPGDPQYKNISSLVLLQKINDILREKGCRAGNVDATVVAEQPRLREYIDSMRQNFARVLGIPVDQVSVKASTSDHLGFEGRGEGVSAWAVALLRGTRPENGGGAAG